MAWRQGDWQQGLTDAMGRPSGKEPCLCDWISVTHHSLLRIGLVKPTCLPWSGACHAMCSDHHMHDFLGARNRPGGTPAKTAEPVRASCQPQEATKTASVTAPLPQGWTQVSNCRYAALQQFPACVIRVLWRDQSLPHCLITNEKTKINSPRLPGPPVPTGGL